MRRSSAMILTSAGIALLTFASYWPAVRGSFIWDDDSYVVNNPHLRTFAGLSEIWTDPKATPQYYPLVHTTFWVEYQLWGLAPAGYHLVNILLHATSAVLLLVLLRRLEVPGALLAAAVFAVHPVHVESVAWITERKNVLSLVFYLLAAWTYLARLEAKPASARGRGLYALALALFVCALLSKTVTCTLPAALLLVLYWKRGRIAWNDVWPLLPFFACGLALGLTTAWLERVHVGAEGGDWSLPFFHRFLLAGRIIVFYAAKLVWPNPLVFIYPRWQVDPSQWWQYLYSAGVLAACSLLWFGRGRLGRGPLVAVLFFMGTLFPALGFIDVYPMRFSYVADHFQYHASIGLIVLMAAALTRFAIRLDIPRAARPAAVIVVAALAVLTWRQTAIYRDLQTLWTRTLEQNPTAWLAHGNLGNIMRARGLIAEAEHHYGQVLRYNPTDAGAINNLGNLCLEQDRVDQAIPLYERALALKPDLHAAKHHLAKCYARRQRYAEAIALLEDRVRHEPGAAESYNLRGEIAEAQGQPAQALPYYLKVVELRPEWTSVANNAAWILATCPDDRIRDGAKAVVLAERACGIGQAGANPGFAAMDTLAAAYAEAGRFKDAVEAGKRARAGAEQQGDRAMAEAIAERIRLYDAAKPYRDRR